MLRIAADYVGLAHIVNRGQYRLCAEFPEVLNFPEVSERSQSKMQRTWRSIRVGATTFGAGASRQTYKYIQPLMTDHWTAAQGSKAARNEHAGMLCDGVCGWAVGRGTLCDIYGALQSRHLCAKLRDLARNQQSLASRRVSLRGRKLFTLAGAHREALA